MLRGALVVAAFLGAVAPYQCKSNDADRARDETPGEALWALCGRFAQHGDDEGARTTLDELMERYPSSRFAKRAKDERVLPHPCATVAASTSARPAASSARSAP